MNATTDYKLFLIQDRIWRKTDERTSVRAIDPLVWYISTGRAPASVELAINRATSRQLTTIANRLIKADEAGGTFDDALKAVKPYLYHMAGI